MRSVCAWCGKLLGDTHASPVGTTHGICAPCDRELRLVELRGDAPGDEPARRTNATEHQSLRKPLSRLPAQPD
jgi:hypothetical protein